MEHIESALENEEEFFLRNNAIEQVKDSLGELWSMRSKREEHFAEVINMLQGVFAGRSVEAFSNDQLAVLRSVFANLRDEPSWDDPLADSVSIELLNGSIDVFREID